MVTLLKLFHVNKILCRTAFRNLVCFTTRHGRVPISLSSTKGALIKQIWMTLGRFVLDVPSLSYSVCRSRNLVGTGVDHTCSVAEMNDTLHHEFFSTHCFSRFFAFGKVSSLVHIIHLTLSTPTIVTSYKKGNLDGIRNKIMSSSLVKRLLRASADLNETTASERPTKRRRHKHNLTEDSPPVTKEEILASQVRQLLAMDGTAKDMSQKVTKRLDKKQKEQKSTAQTASRAIVTNSRSAALQATQEHEKTFDKKAYKRDKEKKKLQRLAQQLKMLSKKKK